VALLQAKSRSKRSQRTASKRNPLVDAAGEPALTRLRPAIGGDGKLHNATAVCLTATDSPVPEELVAHQGFPVANSNLASLR
jgi:hypothetical protein